MMPQDLPQGGSSTRPGCWPCTFAPDRPPGACRSTNGPLTLLVGPQRLEAGWLQGPDHCALRDYYVARSATAGLLWVYRERLGGQAAGVPASGAQAIWYLHGIFA
jgi:protein ImuB